MFEISVIGKSFNEFEGYNNYEGYTRKRKAEQ